MWDLLNWRGEIAKSQRAYAPDPQIPRVDPPKVPWEAERREAPLAPHQSPWLARLEAEFQGFGHKDLTLTYTHQSVFRFCGLQVLVTIVFLAFEYASLSLTLSHFRFVPPLLLLADCPSSQQHQYHEQNTRQYFLTSYGLTNVPWLNWVSGQGAGVYVQRSLFCTGVITARRQHPPATVLCHGVIAEPKSHGPEEEFWRGT